MKTAQAEKDKPVADAGAFLREKFLESHGEHLIKDFLLDPHDNSYKIVPQDISKATKRQLTQGFNQYYRANYGD